MLRVVAGDGASAEMMVALDEICREGARRMLAVALEAEADTRIAGLAGERDENGHRLVVGNGHAEGPGDGDGGGPDRDHRTPGRRQTGRRGHWGAVPVLEFDHRAVVPQEPEGV